MTINECNHQEGMVQRHIFIKTGSKREERFQGESKLKEALLDRTYIIKNVTKTLIFYGLNPYIAVSLYKITSIMSIRNRMIILAQNPLLSNRELIALIHWPKLKEEKRQILKSKLKLKTIAYVDGKIDINK